MMTDYEQIYEFENLYNAHKLARRGKQNEREIVKYELYLTENLEKLAWQLKNHTYQIGRYKKFTIYDPKEREIQALSYNDRVLQHSLCDNVLGPYLEKRLIYDNAACRVGKGSHFAMNRLAEHMRKFYKLHGTNGWILKCDIRKYFDSIDHEILLQKIEHMKLNADTKGLLRQIVNSYEKSPGRGLPMGNQTSQWFALYYLDGLDRLVKEKLQIKFYSRYMDDMILLHEDKEYLQNCLKQMSEYVEEKLHLEFNSKTQIHSITQGTVYLGFRFYLTDTGKVVRLLRQSSKKRINKKMRALRRLYRNGKISSDDVQRSLVSYSGHLSHGNTHRLRKRVISQMILYRKSDEIVTK